MINKYYILKKV